MFSLQRFVTCLNDAEHSKYLFGYSGRNITAIIITSWFRWDDASLVRYPRHTLTYGWWYADATSSKSGSRQKKPQALTNYGTKIINFLYETKHELILRAKTIITNIFGAGLRVIKFQSRNIQFFFPNDYLTFGKIRPIPTSFFSEKYGQSFRCTQAYTNFRAYRSYILFF